MSRQRLCVAVDNRAIFFHSKRLFSSYLLAASMSCSSVSSHDACSISKDADKREGNTSDDLNVKYELTMSTGCKQSKRKSVSQWPQFLIRPPEVTSEGPVIGYPSG